MGSSPAAVKVDPEAVSFSSSALIFPVFVLPVLFLEVLRVRPVYDIFEAAPMLFAKRGAVTNPDIENPRAFPLDVSPTKRG